jgi:hypothetical protein
MFAAVIKNTILIFFVICIGYFLVDNHLNEMDSERQKLSKKANPSEVKKFTTRDQLNKYSQHSNDIPQESHAKPMSITIDPELKEIYNYVYNDMKASDDLTAMYVNTEARDVEKDSQIICESDTHSPNTGLGFNNLEAKKMESMCSDPIKEHHDKVSYDHIQVKSISDQSMYNFVDKHI